MKGFVRIDCPVCRYKARVRVEFPRADAGFVSKLYVCPDCGTELRVADSGACNGDGEIRADVAVGKEHER